MTSGPLPPDSAAAESRRIRGGASDSGGERANMAERAFAILEYIVQEGGSVSVSDIIEELALPKPTAYRLVEWFEGLGFLAREPGRRRITVGPRLTELALGTLRAGLHQAPRRAILEALANEVGETCNIGVVDRGAVVYLDRVEVSQWPLRLQFHAGSRVPLHCSAMGKLFLAHMPARQRRATLDSLVLTAQTPQTITDRDRLLQELKDIRERGASFDREEFLAGVICIAVPVTGPDGEVLAAIAAQAPTARMSEADAVRHLPALRRAAERLAKSFAGEGDAAPLAAEETEETEKEGA